VIQDQLSQDYDDKCHDELTTVITRHDREAYMAQLRLRKHGVFNTLQEYHSIEQ